MGFRWCRWCCRRARTAEAFTIGDEAYVGPGTVINSGFLDGLDIDAAKRAAIDALARQGVGRRRDQLAAARLGGQPATLLGLPDPGHPLSGVRRGAGAGRAVAGGAARRRDVRPAGQSARPSSDAGSTCAARAATGRRRARPTRSTPSSTAPGTLRGSAARTRRSRCRARRPSTGCRSISISAASSTRSCICSMRGSSPARCARPAISTWPSRSPACSPRAW